MKRLGMSMLLCFSIGSGILNAGDNRCFDCQVYWKDKYKGTWSVKEVEDKYEAETKAMRIFSKSYKYSEQEHNNYSVKCHSKVCW